MKVALDKVFIGYRAFADLPFAVRRTILAVVSFAGWFLGAMFASKHFNNLALPFLFAGAGGFMWATGLYKLWRPLLKALIFYLRFIR